MKLELFYKIHQKEIWGFYNVAYDQYILKAILLGENPKAVNDWIIDGNPGWKYREDFRTIPLITYDVMTVRKGLKVLEGYMGSSIYESKVDFTINRKLTPEELDETIRYCRNDVYETIRVFGINISEFQSQMGLVQQFKLPLSNLSKTKAQLSAVILCATKTPYFDEFDFRIPPQADKLIKYRSVVDWFKTHHDYEESLVMDVAGVEHTFAWGGLHGAREHYIAKSDSQYQLYHIDAHSYYPSIMIHYDCLSRSVASRQKFIDIYNSRLEYKKNHDSRAGPLKIVVNSTYGSSKDVHNPLYDPWAANTVCVTGQILLTWLIELLEPYVELIQSNTDGLIIKTDNPDKTMEICEYWERETKMTLGKDKVQAIWQSDVNNYLMLMPNGKIDSKGVFKIPSQLDNELLAVKVAVADYFINGVPVETTINECQKLMDFQKIVKIDRKTYDFGVHYENGKPIIQNENVYRVFASKDRHDGEICKAKNDWLSVDLNYKETVTKADKFANTPKHCKIMNGSVKNLPVPEWLDRKYYIELAKTYIQRVE